MILHHVIFSTNKKQTLNFILFYPIICNIYPILHYYKLCLKDWSQIAKKKKMAQRQAFWSCSYKNKLMNISSFTLALIWDLAQCFRLHCATVHPDWTFLLCFFVVVVVCIDLHWVSQLLARHQCTAAGRAWLAKQIVQQTPAQRQEWQNPWWNPWISLAPGNS